ncbi:MAG: hypothetical protein HYW15_03005 [Candidatus Giovannonibacteria bacterium]|nr:MAG: hypothetical protein HYW15_03005 [Candidatus Giovannonibacteria bacterium]
MAEYNGHYSYDLTTVSGWESKVIGVYYIGYLSGQNLTPVYVGKATGLDGIRGRLLDHLNENNWSDASYFGYRICNSAAEAEQLEAAEIRRCQPRYNELGK